MRELRQNGSKVSSDFNYVTMVEDPRRIGGVLECCSIPKLLEKLEMFRLSEILRRRSEIFITYLYKNALFHMNM